MQNFKTSALEAWLLLTKAPKLGPIKSRNLVRRLGNVENVISASTKTLRELKTPSAAIRWLKSANSSDIANELNWCKQNHHHTISILDETYPYLLKQLKDAPNLLFIKGNINLLSLPQLAIVGSRNPTNNGKQLAFEFAQYLTQSGLLINSGLAQGIDAASHQGALKNGNTIAVCATGLDQVYPRKHQVLAQQIEKQGALVSEFLPGTELHKAYFPRRNRLISGLSIGTLVVEASIRSGSLITAQYALEQNREVFAIPGSIHNPMAKGCHKLIRQGAKLVETAQDILEELQNHLQLISHNIKIEANSEGPSFSQQKISHLNNEQQSLLEIIAYKPISIDEIVESSKFKPEKISSMLLILELEGLVSNIGSGRYTRT